MTTLTALIGISLVSAESPAWNVEVPSTGVLIGGGIRGDNEYEAMRAGVRQVQMQLQGIETQLARAIALQRQGVPGSCGDCLPDGRRWVPEW